MSTISTMDELRAYLAQQALKLTAGEITAASANASANICGKIISSVKTELEINKLAGTKPNIAFVKSLNKEIDKLETSVNAPDDSKENLQQKPAL
jgi:hypothetical protein